MHEQTISLSVQVLQKADDSTLKLVNIDENQKKGVAPAIFLKIVQSPIFTTVVMIVVLTNTIFTATIHHTHNERIDRRNLELYHQIEVELDEISSAALNKLDLDGVHAVLRFGNSV